MQTDAQDFVVSMITACINFEKPDSHLGDTATFEFASHSIDATDGYGVVLVKVGDRTVYTAHFQIRSKAEVWRSAICEISEAATPQTESSLVKLVCELQQDGSLRVRPIVVARMCRDLTESLRFALKNLGRDAGEVSRVLRNRGFEPTLDGLLRYLIVLLALTNVQIVQEEYCGNVEFVITGHRLGDPSLEVRAYKLAPGVAQFIRSKIKYPA